MMRAPTTQRGPASSYPRVRGGNLCKPAPTLRRCFFYRIYERAIEPQQIWDALNYVTGTSISVVVAVVWRNLSANCDADPVRRLASQAGL